MRKKAIHNIIWSATSGGIELLLHYNIEYFTKDRDVFVFGLRPVEKPIYDVQKVNYREGARNNRNLYYKYYKYCRQYRGDIFHLFNAGPIILILTLLAGVRCPIYHIRGTIYWNSTFQKIYLKVAWYLSKMLGKVTFIANSQYSAGIFQKMVLPIPLDIIYNGLPIEKYRKNKRCRQQPIHIGYVGRLATGKNVELAIKLFEELAIDHPQAYFSIAGDGPLRKTLEEQVNLSPHKDRIRFLGFVKDVSEVYTSLDVLIFLSDYESFGNVLAEALINGLPILTSDVKVFSEIHNGEKAFDLGSPGDYNRVKEKFLDAIANFQKLAQKAFEMSDRVAEKFNIRTHLMQIEQLYEKY